MDIGGGLGAHAKWRQVDIGFTERSDKALRDVRPFNCSETMTDFFPSSVRQKIDVLKVRNT